MATPNERNWTAHIVFFTSHAGLEPYFKRLQAELYHTLASIDDSREVRDYLCWLMGASAQWCELNDDLLADK